MKEIVWTDVEDFLGFYQVNNIGQVRSVDRYAFHRGNKAYHLIRGKILSARINNCGYLSVRLSKDGRNFTRFIHRLMAEAFIENSFNKPFINHKDGVKTNNDPDNLEWVTHSENMIHAYRLGLCKNKKKYSISSIRAVDLVADFRNISLKKIIQINNSGLLQEKIDITNLN